MKILRHLIPLGLVIAIILLSSVGYMLIEGWTFWNSLYFTIFTVATIGAREVLEVSIIGRYYSLLVIIVGALVIGYTLSSFIAFLVGGQLRDMLRAGKMQKRISRLKNHYILCGAGRMGYEAVRALAAEHTALLVIENDEKVIRKLQADGIVTIKGDATQDEVLMQAGIAHARGLLSVLPDDADNLYVALTARGMNPDLFIIVRGSDETSQAKLLRAGANRVILPFLISGRRMAHFLMRPEIVEFTDVVMTGREQSALRIEVVRVATSSSLAGRSLGESNIRQTTGGAMIMGVIRQGGDLLPNPGSDTVILADDRLLAMGRLDQIKKLEEMAD